MKYKLSTAHTVISKKETKPKGPLRSTKENYV
jgi:hypothetical protein